MKPIRHALPRPSSLLLLLLTSCAREEMPPGTGPDFEPPRVVEMFPEPRSAVPDLDEDAFVRFSEPLGDPRSLARLIETSPAWLYEIHAGRRNVRIRPQDGWRSDVVYTFRIPPGVRDLVRNQTREPIEFVFTTGTEFFATRTGGVVWERENVRKARDIAVHVVGRDSVPYAAVSDTGGNFALAGLPVGEYWAFAFRDQNRNRIFEREFEPNDSVRVSLSDSTTSVQLELWLTAPDTTPPLLGAAEARDSLNVRLEFDDLLEPDAPLDSATVRITSSETGEEWRVAQFVVGDLEVPDSADTEVTEDSVQVGEAAEDEALQPATDPEEPDEAPGAAPAESPADDAGPESRPRPQRFVSVLLERPLAEGMYEVSAGGFLNLRMLAGGGDTTMVYEPPPAPEVEEAGELEAGESDAGEPDAGEEDAGREGEAADPESGTAEARAAQEEGDDS